jgi:Bacterial signalling protein N terminal repeat
VPLLGNQGGWMKARSMPLIYEPSLVLLSLVIAIQGSYVAPRIALQISGSHGQTRRLLLAGAACSLAVGIWGMHFIGMLAARLPVSVPHPSLVPHLRTRCRCCHRSGKPLATHLFHPRRRANCHGERDRGNALHGHVGAACEHPHGA